MFYRLCCCFGFGQSSATSGLLKKDLPNNQQFYTVHRISSFGRGISNDEDICENEVPNVTGKNCVVIKKNSAMWTSRPVLVQPSIDNEFVSDFEEGAITQQPSPAVKKKSRWGKALSKATKRDIVKNELPHSLQSLANVSMMMLPTITVANSNSSPSSFVNLEGGKNTLDCRSNSSVNLKKYDDVNHLTTTSTNKNSSAWLKSQSMLNVNCASDESDGCGKSNEDIARKYGLDTSLYHSSAHLSKSSEAINKVWKSMEDCDSESGFVDLPMGTLHFTASYNKLNRKLLIQVQKIEGLAPKGEDRHKYNSILKLSVLPHEKHVKYSRIITAHALNIDETFIFTIRDISSKVLRISVFPAAYQGKYDAIGHTLFYMEDALLNSNDCHIMKLYKQSMPDVEPGSLKVTLNYDKSNELLNIRVLRANNLKPYSGKCKTYLKLLQYYAGKKVRESYSPSFAAKSEVEYNYSVNFKIEAKAVSNTYVVVNVKIKGFLKKDTIGGRLIFGPFLYSEYGQKITPWGRIFILREQVSHTFRMYL